jgi:4-hydroxy-tetrahydrodipicolinate synthase
MTTPKEMGGGNPAAALRGRVDWLRACGTALVTPFTHTGAVDEDGFRALVERQIAGGVKVLVPAGTTGEGATLTDAEQERVVRITVEVARGRARVVAGAGSNATAVTVARARAARDAGADAALIVTPYYNKPTQAGLLLHFGTVAHALPDFPIVLYNVPGRTASNITAATALTLAARHQNIVAVKEASGDFSQIMAILRDRPAGFRVLSGDDAVMLPLVALGADGVISVAANEAPDLMTRLTDLALAGDFASARALHYRLLPLMEANFLESNPGPVKAAMALQGLLEEHLRPPLVPVQEQTRARLREVLGTAGLLEKTAARHAVA